MPAQELTVSDLTETTLEGSGVFDVLMKAVKTHLDGEFNSGRIKGTEYSTVYLGSLDLAMQTGISFLLQSRKVSKELDLLDKQIALQEQQRLNAIAEQAVIVANGNKVLKEIELTQANTSRTQEEIALLVQKTATEKAQTKGTGVEPDSVVGKQKALYGAQADGFLRDAEQKAAKLMADTWSVRRTTDEATVADSVNKLSDTEVGRAIERLLVGVGA
jgi:hypothetical protein